MNFKYISQWKVCYITFQNLDLESEKIGFNLYWSLIRKILEFGTKVLSRIRGVQFLNKNWSVSIVWNNPTLNQFVTRKNTRVLFLWFVILGQLSFRTNLAFHGSLNDVTQHNGTFYFFPFQVVAKFDLPLGRISFPKKKPVRKSCGKCTFILTPQEVVDAEKLTKDANRMFPFKL